MARNAGGTYALPLPAVVTATVIASTWANTTLNDLATEMTDSLDRSGKGGMLAPLLGTDGTAGLPSFSFTNEPSTGMYRPAANTLGLSVAGVIRATLTSQAAGGAGTDFLFNSSTTRTAGTLFAIQNNAAAVLSLTNTASGPTLDLNFASTAQFVRTTAANSTLIFKGNRNAADAGADVAVDSQVARTAGVLFDIRNNGTSLTFFNLNGNLFFNAAAGGTIAQAAANLGLTLVGNRNAGDAGADITFDTTATRTAGSLLLIQNNTVARAAFDFGGNLTFTSNAAFATIAQATSGQGLILKGNQTAGAGGGEVAINSSVTRTAGVLFDIQNNAASQFDVGFSGIVHAPNVPQVSQQTADDTNSTTTMQSVAGLSFTVLANANYEAEFFLTANTTATAIHNVQLTGPAAPTKAVMGAQGIFGTIVSGFGAAAFSTPFQLQPANITTEASVIIKLHLQNGANAGTVQLQHASNTAAQAVTIFKGSHVRWSRIDNGGKP